MIAAALAAALLLDESTIGPSPWYAKLVEQYRSGDRAAAVAEEAPPEKFLYEISGLARLVDAVRRAPSPPLRHQLDAFSFPAAVLLHTDRAFAMFERSDPAAQAELELPPRLLSLMSDETRNAFEPRWAYATAVELSRRAQWDPALTLLDPVLKRHPEDALLLLARGAALEALSQRAEDMYSGGSAVIPFGALQSRVQRKSEVERKALGDAEKCYRRALAARPDLHHARVRLGRVLQLRGRSEASVPELQSVIAAATEVRELYLAHLFLGYAREHTGLLDQAAAEYVRAVRTLPDGQAAAVALSHALHRLGRWPASVEALRAGVDRAGRRLVVDPWWPYLVGQPEDPAPLFEALRAEVTP